MEFLKDLLSSFVAGVRERTTNPLTIAFLISWLVWNFRLVLILIGDANTAEKLGLIDDLMLTTYSPPASEWFVEDGFGRWIGRTLVPVWYPLLSALGYVYGYSWVSRGVVKFYRKLQIGLGNELREMERGRLIRPEDVRALSRQYDREIKIKNEELEEKDAVIRALRSQLELTAEPGDEVDWAEKNPSGVTPIDPSATVAEQVDLRVASAWRVLVSLSGGTHTSHEIAADLGLHQAVVKRSLAALSGAGLAKKDPRASFFTATDLGVELVANAINQGKSDTPPNGFLDGRPVEGV